MTEQELIPGNSAGRLLRIIKRIRSTKDNVRTDLAWREVLECPDASRGELLRLVGLTIGLPEQVAHDANLLIDSDPDPFLSWKSDTDKAFASINFDSTFQTVRSPLGPQTVRPLEMLEAMLSRRGDAQQVDRVEIKSLCDEVALLIQSIRDSGLGLATKELLLRKLDEIERALAEVMITGAQGINRVVDSAFGGLALNREVVEEIRDSPFGDRFWTIVSRVADLIQIGGFLLLTAQATGVNFVPEIANNTDTVVVRRVIEDGDSGLLDSGSEETDDE